MKNINIKLKYYILTLSSGDNMIADNSQLTCVAK